MHTNKLPKVPKILATMLIPTRTIAASFSFAKEEPAGQPDVEEAFNGILKGSILKFD